MLGIVIELTNAGIGIPTFIISVQCRTKKMLDLIALVQYLTSAGIVSVFHSGTGLIGCWTVRRSGIYTHACKRRRKDTDKEHGKNMHHGHGVWTSTMDAGMQIKSLVFR